MDRGGMPERSAAWRAGAVVGAVLLALVVRLIGLHGQSLSMDEISELSIAAQSLHRVIVTHDGFPPFYHLLAHGWLAATSSDESLRMLSVLFGATAVAVMYGWGELMAGPRGGLAAAVLLALSPLHVWFSQEARAYSLYFLLALATIYCFWTAVMRNRPRDWTAYVAVATVAMYTHYYTSLVIVALAVAAVADLRSLAIRRRFVGAHLAVAVLCLPLLPLLRGDLGLQQAFVLPRPAADLVALAYAVFTFVAGFSVGPSLRELHVLSPGAAVRAVAPWLLALGAGAVTLLWAALRSPGARPWLWRCALLVVTPLIVSQLLGISLGIGFRVRYVAWAAAPLLAMLALGIAHGWDRWSTRAATAVIALVWLIALGQRITSDRYRNEDMLGAARCLQQGGPAAEPVFVVAGYMASPLRYYLPGRAIDGLRGAGATWDPSDLTRVYRRAGSGGKFWLVYSRAFDGDRDGALLRALQEGTGLVRRCALPGVQVYEGTAPVGR